MTLMGPRDGFLTGLKVAVLTPLGMAVSATGLVGLVGSSVVMSTVGTALGALTGELLDRVPYFKDAIPLGFAYVGNMFTDTDTVQTTYETMKGNLDKVGAAVGFVGGFLRPSVTNEMKPGNYTSN